MEEFFTRSSANEGIKLPLYHPDGTKSEHWLRVRGVDSDEFRRAEATAKRKAMELAQIKDPDERAEAVRETELECIAALVAEWSFEQELTHIQLVTFLREAPQIADMVNRFAVQRAQYYSKKSTSSATGQGVKSSSKRPQKAQKSSKETT